MTSHALVGYSIGPDRPDPGENPGPRFLRKTGYQDAGEDRHRHADCDSVDECAVHLRLASSTRRACAVHCSRRVSEFRNPVLFSAQKRYYQPEPGWAKFFFKIAIAVAALAITLWFGMGSEQSWLTGSGWARIGRLTALVTGGVVVYFAVLAALGFRPRDFSKRGDFLTAITCR